MSMVEESRPEAAAKKRLRGDRSRRKKTGKSLECPAADGVEGRGRIASPEKTMPRAHACAEVTPGAYFGGIVPNSLFFLASPDAHQT